MYLLDTNVISELRRGAKAAPAVQTWSAAVGETECYLCAVTLFELRLGALLKLRRDPEQGRLLLRWIDGVHETFAARTLDVTVQDWMRCADLHVPDPKPLRDSLIAACAIGHDLTLVTRNITDFARLAVRCVNPWEEALGTR